MFWGVSGDVIYGADSGSNNGKIVGINTSGECIEVITYAELGGFRPYGNGSKNYWW